VKPEADVGGVESWIRKLRFTLHRLRYQTADFSLRQWVSGAVNLAPGLFQWICQGRSADGKNCPNQGRNYMHFLFI
jgi:hypothetical protein